MRSKFTLCVTLFCLGVFSAVMCAQTNPVIRTFIFSETSYINKLSDNGKWAVASDVDVNNATLRNYPYLLDVTTGNSYALLSETEKLSSPDCGAMDVTDDGKTVVGSYQGQPAVCKINDDFTYEWTMLPLPEGLEEMGGHVQAVTPDGSCMVGTLYGVFTDASQYVEYPIMWKDGEVVELPNMPVGRDTDDDVEINQNRLLDISADGKVIVGCLMFIYPKFITHYVYHVDEQRYVLLGADDYATTGSVTNTAALSPNGEWVAGTALLITPIEGSDFPDEQHIPYKYNVKEDLFTDYRDDIHHEMAGNVVFNNGLLAVCTPVSNPYRTQSFLIGDYYYDLDLILSERYGIDFFSTTGMDNTGTPISVSADGLTLATIAVGEGNHIITFPESIEEAAKGVNLLSKSSVSPSTGSSFSDFRTLTVTFDKAPTIVSGMTATLSEYGSTETLRSSINVAPTTEDEDCRSFYINFRPYTLQDGVTYTVTIPAGMFRLGETENYNYEIKVHYIGRKNAPVQVVAASPEDGMEVTSLSYSAPISLQFDTQLALVDGAVGKLYQEGVSAPLSDLTLATSSNMMAAYPVSKHNLYKGANYIVKIPAGSVTDLMGNCANEEISYTYVGAYVPEPPADTLLFADDFSDPSASYNNFMLYEGDHLTPNSTASSWTFDADNTPWIYSIREDDTTDDYCAAAHSMYTTGGQADDWMVTTQIWLPNAFCYLDFDVQSYLSTKADSLEAYVYVDDAIHSQMTDEVIANIRERGVCIYKMKEESGTSEEGLSGDWVHRRISLADFAEKNVYIAFVNRCTNQSALFVDNVEVIYKSSCLLALSTKTTFVAETETTVSGVVKVIDENTTYDRIKIFFSNEEGTVSDTLTATGLELKNGSVYEFTFDKKLPLVIGEENVVTIGVTLGDDTKTTDFTLKNLAFATTRKVVIEEVTGTWCSNCPDGIVAIEHIEEAFPGQVIPICIHQNDNFSMDSYVTALGLNALPTAVVNRIDTIVSPMTIDKSTYEYSFVSAAGNETFMDLVLRELGTEADANVKLTSATYDKAFNRLDIKGSVTYALSKAGIAANVLMVVLEDNLVGVQTNGRANYTDAIYGDWGKNGIYGGMGSVQYSYQDVARAVLCTSYYGMSNLIPATVTSGKEYLIDLPFDGIPSSLTNLANCKVVFMLIDADTGRIINADILPLTDGNPEGIATTETDGQLRILSRDGNVQVCFAESGEAEVTLHTTGGQLVSRRTLNVASGETATLSTQGYTGTLIVRVTTVTGTLTGKVLVEK